MPRRIKFQIALWDHILDDLMHLGELQHRTYKQQATYLLEEAVKQAMSDEERHLDAILEPDHVPAP